MSKKNKSVRCLQIQWGWITPGTNVSHRESQSFAHLDAVGKKIIPETGHFLLIHCGWWLDHAMPAAVRAIYAKNPEPHRALLPASPEYLKRLTAMVRKRRFEFVAYPYAACVSEATTGEGLLRSLRFTRDIAQSLFKKPQRLYMNHDAVYGLDWSTVQMPQILRLLGGGYLVSGKNGTVVAPDGTAAGTFGDARTFYDIVKDPASLKTPGVYCMELHENIELVNAFHEGTQYFTAQMGYEFEAITFDEFHKAKAGDTSWYPSEQIGSKSWYGGTLDSLILEQYVKSVELRLPAIEAFAAQSKKQKAASIQSRLEELWKRSFVLMDNHLLWQCHQYKPHFLREGARLFRECDALERSLSSRTTKVKTVFNSAPWSRDIVTTEKSQDNLIRNAPGWGSKPLNLDTLSAPHLKPAKTSSPYDLTVGDIHYRLGAAGTVESFKSADYRIASAGWGKIVDISESKSHAVRTLIAGQTRIPHRGALMLETEVNLSKQRGYNAILEFGKIRGDAYLLRLDGIDLAGNVFSTKWQAMHSLHWGGGGLPQHESGSWSTSVDIAYAARLRITVWVACEDFAELSAVRLRLSQEVTTISKWRAHLLTAVSYEQPTHLRAKVLRESSLAKCIHFHGDIKNGHFDLYASGDVTSPQIRYHLKLTYPEPVDLGITTPPFEPGDGSLFGAQCERPYIPGLAVEFPLPSAATYHVDKPFYIQQALDDPVSTWHTDRRDWWFGMSPFIGMNMACATWKKDSMAVVTRGLKHFFRWRRDKRESLALSLGATLIHPSTQGHSVPKSSPLYSITGRKNHDPYEETPFLKAHGTYDFHYAIHPGLGKTGERQRLNFWRSAQEFALPASIQNTNAQFPGIASSNPAVTPTALERRGGQTHLRIANMSSRHQSATIRLPFGAPSEVLKIRSLPPWAVREFPLNA